MPSFSGKFQYLRPEGSPAQAGPCHVTVEAETLTLVPGSGAPLVLDLGDIETLIPGDYELNLTLYTGGRIVLQQFGKVFQDLSHDLLEAHRKRLIECLLLEDLEEIARFEGSAEASGKARNFSSPAEFRLYKTNLAMLPTMAPAFQWRLADIAAVNFDGSSYTVRLESAGERLTISKLAKRTQEFLERLEDAMSRLAEESARMIHALFPFLTPDQFQEVAQLLQEGHAAPLTRLQAIDPDTEAALVGNVVDAGLKPYFDILMSHVPKGWLYTGFKLLREGEKEELPTEVPEPFPANVLTQPPAEPEEAVGEEAPAPDQPEGKEPILHWFFFPLSAEPAATTPGNLVAWEATSQTGRATYLFRLLPPEQAGEFKDPAQARAVVDTAVRDLNRALLLLNFRREPIYLPDDSLKTQPRYRRYAIACRKIPELRRLRASFLGRALHTSPQAWEKQVEEFLANM